MTDTIIEGGAVVTMDESRQVFTDGAVAIEGDSIVAVGPTEQIRSDYDADRIIDASRNAVLPGFVDPHTHISSILLRGGNTSDRTLYDWLFNVTKPARAQMTAEEHAIASALFCREALQSGITTIVESAVGGGSGYTDDLVEAKMDVYESAGLRHVFAQSFIDDGMEASLREYVDRKMATEPAVEEPAGSFTDTEEALTTAERLMETYHGSRDGRQSVWSGPLSPRSTTEEGLRGAYRLAEEYDAMTTTHVSETEHEEAAMGDHQTMVEYLDDVGYLGERAVLAHCVHVSDRDIRRLAETGTSVAHNITANLALGAGVAPVEQMRARGVTVGIGTDNATTSDTIDILGDARIAMYTQRGHHRDPTVMNPLDALEMITIDGARAIRRGDELGSIEPGKKADLSVVEMDNTMTTPHYELHSSVLLQAYRNTFETVMCHGEVVVADGEPTGLSEFGDELLDMASDASEDIVRRTGLVELFEGIN